MSHTWKVSVMDYTISSGGKTNVVNTLHWQCSKTDSANNSGYVYGTVSLEAPGESFVEWADITEATAIGWAKAAMGNNQVTAIESGIDAQITEKATPTTGSGVSW